MSSGDEDINDLDGQGPGQENKKRRIQRACDICRRKKIRCDGGQMPHNRCSNCIAYNFDCTYIEAAKKRGPPKGYVESLENRLENMEKLLQRLCPDADFTQELGTNLDRDGWFSDKAGSSSLRDRRDSRAPSPQRGFAATPHPPDPRAHVSIDPDDLVPSDDELGHTTLAEGLKRLALSPVDRRFHGKSSGVMLVQAALNLKREFVGYDAPKDILVPPTRRPEFWNPHSWEMALEEQSVQYHYPPEDLLFRLVDNFFIYFNPFLPILHRPSFERALNKGKHNLDVGFGSVVLLVCAVGARWSDDPRTHVENEGEHSAGWKYFDQVQSLRKSLLAPPRLYDLQIYALSSIFLYGTSSPQASWTMVGIGIRLAQDVGAHRRKVYNAPISVESELWKRAFWVLVALDRSGSAALGRPCAIQDEDFDLDFPLEVDDDYWENPDPNLVFKQPPGVPSNVQYFNSFLKLTQIQAFALRTIYSINKSKIILGFVGPQWEQYIVAELDSALNKWIDTVPEHLRWDPHRENFLHFSQSATLFATYYHIQILIHRPFIPSPRRPSPLTFPSLAICTNAARSCSHVADMQRKRGSSPLPHLQVAVFTSGIVLLLNIWGAKKSGMNVDSVKQMADVHKCMLVLSSVEDRWPSAGKLWDILRELTHVGDLPLPQAQTPPSSNKRERDSDSPMSAAMSSNSPGTQQASPAASTSSARPIAGRRSLGSGSTSPGAHTQPPSSTSSTPAVHPGALPFGSDQLAHGGMTFPPAPAPAPADMTTPWYPPAAGQTADPVQHQFNAPNMNLYDFFQADPQLMGLSLPPDAVFQSGMPQHGVAAAKSGFTHSDPSQPAYIPPLDGDANFMSNSAEALMWSTAPASFDFEDWGSYVHNVSGTSRLATDCQPEPVTNPSR